MIGKWGNRLLFAAGFLLCCFPVFFNFLSQKEQSDAITTYQSSVEEKKDELENIWIKAQKYNSMLWQSDGGKVREAGEDILSDEEYKAQLDISGTGVMGSLDIPKINVELPVYHGAEESALSNGAGHIQGTSLPVGGTNTHSVLTGHRGLPRSKLLTRLDEMEKGDYFFLHVCNETLAYKVCDIKVVEPEDVSVLKTEPGRDLVSIVTCTPYGLNTHRLIVTGERVEYQEAQYRKIPEAVPSGRELLFTLFPFAALAAASGLGIRDRLKSRRKRKPEEKRKRRRGKKYIKRRKKGKAIYEKK